MFLIVVGLGAATGFASSQLKEMGLPPILLVGLATVLAVAAIWLSIRYWQAIDEAAREAQKSAWLWGGGLGMAFAMVLLALVSKGALPLPLLPPDFAAADLLFLGGMTMVAAQIAGFLVAWAFWWWSKR
jgi:hypothetical protein